MSKLHNGITAVLLLGVALLGADRIRHSGPDREVLRQIEELRKAQNAARGPNEMAREHHEAYAVPATKAWVQQALPGNEMPEENDAPSAAAGRSKSTPLTMEDMQTGLDRMFYAAPRDRSWGVEAEGIVRNALQRTVSNGSRVETINCNGSLCRIETTHASAGEYQKFVEGSINGPETGLWNGPVFSSVVRDERGELTVVSFIAREGTALPEVAQM
jgi:hypothetical protein